MVLKNLYSFVIFIVLIIKGLQSSPKSAKFTMLKDLHFGFGYKNDA